MAQELWLLRHGDAADARGGDDAARPLTEKGERQSTWAGRALAAFGPDLSAVLSSPRVRARDTARLAVASLGLEVELHEPLSGGFDREAALRVLADRGADERVLLVGHEPDFSQLVLDLTGGRVEMRKGGLAAVRIGRGSGELLVLMRPAELKRVG
jgi:phosphohistidine phosphatase